jgi:hypothetical protein
MTSVFLPLILFVLQSSLTECEEGPCFDCASPAEVDQKIVDFALQELAGAEGGLCKKNVVKVENFEKQVRCRVF